MSGSVTSMVFSARPQYRTRKNFRMNIIAGIGSSRKKGKSGSQSLTDGKRSKEPSGARPPPHTPRPHRDLDTLRAQPRDKPQLGHQPKHLGLRDQDPLWTCMVQGHHLQLGTLGLVPQGPHHNPQLGNRDLDPLLTHQLCQHHPR